jgi:sugar phosphate isomerase/epimerase
LRTTAERTEIRRLTEATGVEVLYIEMISLSEATRVPDHRADIETGAAIGATRVGVAGDSANFDVVAEKLAGIADLAAEYGLAVDIEFMPFRQVKTFADARDVIGRAGKPNVHVMVDALHAFRSGSPLAEIAAAPRSLIGTLQLCDAPAKPPPPDQLVVEARTRRGLPGEGGLDLQGLLAALPADVPLGVEVPLAAAYPRLSPAERLTLLARATRNYLSQRSLS